MIVILAIFVIAGFFIVIGHILRVVFDSHPIQAIGDAIASIVYDIKSHREK